MHPPVAKESGVTGAPSAMLTRSAWGHLAVEIRLNAREDSPDDWYSHHPSLEDLVANTGQVDP